MRDNIFICIISVLAICSCSQGPIVPSGSLEEEPDIYPDYKEVTIPPNIAPLDFCVNEPHGEVSLMISGGDASIYVKGSSDGNFEIPMSRWKKLLASQKGSELEFTVFEKRDGKWWSFKPFRMHVAEEEVDPYLAYRLIPPEYAMWRPMGIYQRNLETFEQSPIMENKITDEGCMNCHSFPNQNPRKMMFHMRAKHAGTFLMQDGKMEKLNTKTPETISAFVYPYWHPSENYIAFTVTKSAQSFFMNHPNRIEYVDTLSDVVVYDIRRHEAFSSPLIKSEERFETFPSFSPDGKTLFFCTSKAVGPMPEHYKDAHYSLCSIAFDAESRTFGNQVDTVFNAGDSLSGCLPRVSPDGRYLAFARQQFGHLAIWHNDSDLWIIDLQNGEAEPLTEANSARAESYHSWSHNSRWLVFGSRRGDGLYTRPYFTYIDADGHARKPFLLPQRNPRKYYDGLFFSYNIPELITGKVKASRYEINKLMRTDKGIDVTYSKAGL
jgi:hypothetical protein